MVKRLFCVLALMLAMSLGISAAVPYDFGGGVVYYGFDDQAATDGGEGKLNGRFVGDGIEIVDGLGGRMQGVPREDGFEITVASEIMAILCLSKDIADLKAKVAQIIVGYTYDDKPVTVADLKIQGAVAAVLKDALKPNLVQTLEHTPAFIHGGPFANIAHGCNSVMATKMALKLGDITEALQRPTSITKTSKHSKRVFQTFCSMWKT